MAVSSRYSFNIALLHFTRQDGAGQSAQRSRDFPLCDQKLIAERNMRFCRSRRRLNPSPSEARLSVTGRWEGGSIKSSARRPMGEQEKTVGVTWVLES
ncbi:hypothetical protein AVEN_219833-1 [Araneus ventricosus]|uniref:Uncharacterized protein n=1 Tax=Araneus ventricosus TaxID=182803 RepID=A0A4Y2JU44_ARAVE|nr:hypothetical protein AVEN_219833-1 [Araneus ventricosus]